MGRGAVFGMVGKDTWVDENILLMNEMNQEYVLKMHDCV